MPDWILAPALEDPETLQVLEQLAQQVADETCPGAWLMIIGAVVVGLISYKHAPAAHSTVEIGYGVAPAWRGRGVAGNAVAEVIEIAKADHRIAVLTAETLDDNIASQRVLLRNGFKRVARRTEPEGAPFQLWRLALRD